jgi:transcription elongation factor SPT4
MSVEKPRNLRSCLLCSVVLPYNDFYSKGCPNCEDLLTLRLSNDNILEMTSQVFEGLITLHDPSTSWVAKWQRLSEYKPGIYATKVVGRLPDDIVSGLEEQNVKYVPRDGSANGADDLANM